MGIFSKKAALYPITLSDGKQMNITLDSPLPQEFIFKEFVRFDEKEFERQIFDWHPDMVTNLTNQMHMQDYLSMAKEMSDTYYEIAPLQISSKHLKLTRAEGIGILSEEGLAFFWETRYRFNILFLAHSGTRSMSQLDHFRFASLNEGAVCRRSPAPELVENEIWLISPSLNNYANRNTDSLKLFFSLQLLQDKYQN